MRLTLTILVSIFLIAGAITYSVTTRDVPPSLGPADGHDLPRIALDRVVAGTEAPDFTLEALSGDVVTLSQYRGEKTVVLVFYRGHW